MKSATKLFRVISLTVISAILSLPCGQSARAEMVSTESFMSSHQQSTPRERVMMMLQREGVLNQLRKLGVSPVEARERLASLSDSEIEKLNKKIDQLPVGADAAEAVLGTALAVFFVLLITDLLCLTKVFKFTRCAGR